MDDMMIIARADATHEMAHALLLAAAVALLAVPAAMVLWRVVS